MSIDNDINILTWNLENLFHPNTGGPRCDFTPHEGWTVERYQSKIERVSNALNEIIKKHSGPFIFGFTEVENLSVLDDLSSSLPKRFRPVVDDKFKENYFDSVMLYDSDFFEVISCKYHRMFERYDKGDVLETRFRLLSNGSELTAFCCHLKARPENCYYTSMYRRAVCDNMQTMIWKMHGGYELNEKQKRIKDSSVLLETRLPLTPNIVLMGDFNDEPFSSSIIEYLGATYDRKFVIEQENVFKAALYNSSWEKLMSERPGSYHYKKAGHSKWSMLDQIMISKALLTGESSLKYQDGSFKIISEFSSDENGIPFRIRIRDEEGGFVWQDGFSDHFPVMIKIGDGN